MNISITITGVSDLLMHNGRLANPFDPHTRALAELTGIKGKKSEEYHIKVVAAEARGGFWETEDGLAGIPTAAFWRAIRDGAAMEKRGKLVAAALIFDDTTVPLLVDGQPVRCEDYLKRDGAIDYRMVRVGAAKIGRSRPKFSAGWQSTHQFQLDDELLNKTDIERFAKAAGRLRGIGDYRPMYGRFEAKIS